MAQSRNTQTSSRVRVAQRVKGRFPRDVRIVAMGLAPEDLQVLTPRARKLTKEDLVKMWAGKETEETLALTTTDINSIRSAFSGQIANEIPFGLDQSLQAGDINCCCCCCPCCCAEAVTAPVSRPA